MERMKLLKVCCRRSPEPVLHATAELSALPPPLTSHIACQALLHVSPTNAETDTAPTNADTDAAAARMAWRMPAAVSRAFSCLSDADKRAAYDRYGSETPGLTRRHQGGRGPFTAQGEVDPEELFNMFFNGGFGGAFGGGG